MQEQRDLSSGTGDAVLYGSLAIVWGCNHFQNLWAGKQCFLLAITRQTYLSLWAGTWFRVCGLCELEGCVCDRQV